MITNIRIKNYKAIRQVELKDLKKINVICGMNNSGKTTILEALCKKDCWGIGKKVDDIHWMVELFSPEANKYSGPASHLSVNWFTNYVAHLISMGTIWYSDEKENIQNRIRTDQKEDKYLRNYSSSIYDYMTILDEFFKKQIEYFNPVLIPPKRFLEYQTTINVDEEMDPSGGGITNKLFFLKNQDLSSDDYKIFNEIYDTFYTITGSRFNIVPEKNNLIRLLYYTGTKWIPAVDSGLGLSDILVIISYINICKNNVLLIEEPENHLHASFQRRLLDYFQSIKNKQIFITTHSSVFLDTNSVDKIYYCEMNNQVLISDQTSKSKIIQDLGYSVAENLVADLIVLLEGPNDIPVIKEMLSWIGITNQYNIKFYPLGGDIMASLDLTIFAERKNLFALIDSDPGSSAQRTRFLRNCKKNGVYCRKLERYSLENYFPIEKIRKVFPNQIPMDISSLSKDISVDVQIGFKKKNKTIKTKNEKIVKIMKLADIENTDLYQFIFDIKDFIESQKARN